MICDRCGIDCTSTVEWTITDLAPFTVRGRSTLASAVTRLCRSCGGAEEPDRPVAKRGKR